MKSIAELLELAGYQAGDHTQQMSGEALVRQLKWLAQLENDHGEEYLPEDLLKIAREVDLVNTLAKLAPGVRKNYVRAFDRASANEQFTNEN